MDKASFYYEFENRFRGSRHQVKNILSGYTSLLNRIIKRTSDKPCMLDLGCGRGEWIQLCEDKGFNCTGIENNIYMNELNSSMHLRILEGDVFDILPNLSDKKFDLITAFHFIEHINHDFVIRLLVECKRLLSDEGFLLLETPSIDNLSVASKLFFLDPTHINPINPDGLVFLLENIGYHAKYFFINGGPLQESREHTLTRVLNGVSQDVCIIATKSELIFNELFKQDISWQNHLHKSISTIAAAEDHDNYLRNLEFRILTQEEAIFDLRKKLIYYESSLKKILSLRDKIYKLPFFSLFKFVKCILKKLFLYTRKILLLILSYIINFKIHIMFLWLFSLLMKNKILFRIFSFTIKRLGLKRYLDKLQYRIDQERLTNIDSIELDNKLLRYYTSTPLVKKIFYHITKLDD